MSESQEVTITNIFRAVFSPIFFRQKIQTQTVSRLKLHKRLLYKKAIHEMLVILTPGVNFINIKRAYERLFSSYVLALNELSYKKICAFTVDEIDGRC